MVPLKAIVSRGLWVQDSRSWCSGSKPGYLDVPDFDTKVANPGCSDQGAPVPSGKLKTVHQGWSDLKPSCREGYEYKIVDGWCSGSKPSDLNVPGSDSRVVCCNEGPSGKMKTVYTKGGPLDTTTEYKKQYIEKKGDQCHVPLLDQTKGKELGYEFSEEDDTGHRWYSLNKSLFVATAAGKFLENVTD